MSGYRRLEIDACSHMGVVRKANEDMAIIGRTSVRDAECTHSYVIDAEPRSLVVAVMDGVGGHAGGGDASRRVGARLGAAVGLWSPDVTAEEMLAGLVQALSDAHRELGQLRADGERPPGTTCTAVAWSRAGVILAHAGDSRAYRIRDGILNQLTRDHSAASTEPNRRPALANCIGGGTDGVVEAEDLTTRLLAGDQIVIVTDGVLASVDGSPPDPDALLRALETGSRGAIDASLALGAPDNCTAVLVRLVE